MFRITKVYRHRRIVLYLGYLTHSMARLIHAEA